MNTDQSLSSLRLAILCLLLQAPRSGYQLKKVFEETPMGHFSASPGAIYPAVRGMEADGWISGTVENPGSLRPTRTLSLTEKGFAFLRTHFSQPVVEQDVALRMDQLMLRFAFMSPLVGRRATCTFLEQLIDALASHISSLQTAYRKLDKDPVEGVLALQQGIESYKCKVRWARNALRVLTGKVHPQKVS